MDRKTVVIRKYENRRLYDTAASRYVNLDEVAGMVRAGADVQVVDAATGEDITRIVLTQIIVDDAKAPGSSFPIDMLRQMVVASGRAGQESMLKYMRTMFDMYQNAYRTFAPPAAPFDFVGMMGGAPRGPEPPRPPAASPAPPQSPEDEVGNLKRRVEELESAIARSMTNGSRGKRKRAARR